MRDSQRSAVYKWEQALPGRPGKFFNSLDEIKDFLKYLIHSETGIWYKIFLKDGRGTRSASFYNCIIDNELFFNFPKWSRNQYVVLHEAAHALNKIKYKDTTASHGPEFVEIYLHLLEKYTGLDKIAAMNLAAESKPKVRWRPKYNKHKLLTK